MFYESTRGDGKLITSAEAIQQGISPDGGLFIPESKPIIKLDEIFSLVQKSYGERCAEILKPYLSDFTSDEITQCVNDAYNNSNFDHPDIAPVANLDRGLSVLELWHGPTCAFKDMALQILPRLLVKSMEKTGEAGNILILVATSGDTGKAALEGFKDVPHTAIVVFYPEQGVSEVQKLQMITQEGNNVGVFAVRGNFDDAQSGVKEIFGDTATAQIISKYNYKFSSANSINWGRLVPQIAYYFSAYAELIKQGRIQLGEKVNYVVPTGNFGNILAGFYAREMGLPVNKLICASNANDVLDEFIKTGVYNRMREFKKTLSPSMDILISSNLERLLFELTGHNPEPVRKWMSQLKQSGSYQVEEEIREKILGIFWSSFATDKETMQTIRGAYQCYNYVMDTHTAVGLNVYEKYLAESSDPSYTVIVSTASPFKFNASVARALLDEEKTHGKSEFDLLEMLSEFSQMPVPAGLKDLDLRPVLHSEVVEKNNMKQAVLSFIKK
ncbi:threonine synthase [Desulfotruncus alcoholivorax]|uniref:threonine synthase n=1 Tax=Desulfotruncus alcoholivorax TaxID=265477 RepID=UPI0003F88D48|nr:threonine synthase [Desulfotruncus alcoholivorax]